MIIMIFYVKEGTHWTKVEKKNLNYQLSGLQFIFHVSFNGFHYPSSVKNTQKIKII